MNRTTLLIADDHPIVLDGLTALAHGSKYSVIVRCRNGTEVVEALQRLDPDILLLDVNMPAPGGLEIARTLKQSGHRAAIVILTSEISDSQIVVAMQLGISGLVLKETAVQQLISCLDAVRIGQRWFDPEIAKRALTAVVEQRAANPIADRLTPRELDVVRLVSLGLRNKDVARELTITEGTVKMYLQSIYEKLNVADRYELARLIRDRGLF